MFVSNGHLVTKSPVLSSPSMFPRTYLPPMSAELGGWSAYNGLYERQLWVFVVVRKRALATARLPLPVYLRDELNRPRADEHPLSRLLREPNPGMSGFKLLEWTSSTFDIYGEAYWLKRRQRGEVVELYPLHPGSMTRRDGAWSFDNGSMHLERIEDRDLVAFRSFNPSSLLRGMSPLEPLRSTLENEWHARSATSSFWQRGARPGMALTHPTNISEPAADRLRAQMAHDHSGSGKTGGTLILEEGMKPETMTLTAEEAQYIETRKLNREEVCAAYDIPPPVVHILDRATFSNITEQMRSMYRDTMAPHLRGIEAAIETDLRAVEWPQDPVYAEFLMDEVLRGDFESRQDALNKASHMTIAEKRKMENLPFIEGTDRIFLNTATMPLDAIDAQAAAIAQSVPLPAVRSVAGRLSWQKTLDQVDEEKVTVGLAPEVAAAVRSAIGAARAAGDSVPDLRARLLSLSDGKEPTRVPAPDVSNRADAAAEQIARFFVAQARAVAADGWDDPAMFDGDLTELLHVLTVAVSSSVGRAALESAGVDYDTARTVEFLRAVAERIAPLVNASTREAWQEADDKPAVFTEAAEVRAPVLGVGVTTLAANFGLSEAAKRLADGGKRVKKTWVTGRNPRASHAALDGQTVGYDEDFSNGQAFPGSGGSADEVAGCNCSISIEYED